VGANGMGANGMGANGMGANGMGANGMGANGMGANGMGANGMGANAMGANAMGPNMNMRNFMPPPILPEDVLLNPYDAPLRDDRIMQSRGGFIPINVPTQSFDTNYRQVGILTRVKGKDKDTILPLMGRPLFTNRDKWNFYTMNDSNNVVKLPITFKGRSCTSEYGCDNLYNGDIVFVEGYNEAFKVTAYDNQVMRYIPFI
jgi:hypothetical protein